MAAQLTRFAPLGMLFAVVVGVAFSAAQCPTSPYKDSDLCGARNATYSGLVDAGNCAADYWHKYTCEAVFVCLYGNGIGASVCHDYAVIASEANTILKSNAAALLKLYPKKGAAQEKAKAAAANMLSAAGCLTSQLHELNRACGCTGSNAGVAGVTAKVDAAKKCPSIRPKAPVPVGGGSAPVVCCSQCFNLLGSNLCGILGCSGC